MSALASNNDLLAAAADAALKPQLCAFNASAPQTTPVLAAGIKTWAIDITLHREYAPDDTGEVDWLVSGTGGFLPFLLGIGAATGAFSSTVTFWHRNTSGGGVATGVSQTLPAGRMTIVCVADGTASNTGSRRIFINGAFGTNPLWQSDGNDPSINAAALVVGERPGTGSPALSRVHGIMTDTVAWLGPEAEVWNSGVVPDTGGVQYTPICPNLEDI